MCKWQVATGLYLFEMKLLILQLVPIAIKFASKTQLMMLQWGKNALNGTGREAYVRKFQILVWIESKKNQLKFSQT